MDENLRRARALQEEVSAGVAELQLPAVDRENLQHQLDVISQEHSAQVRW